MATSPDSSPVSGDPFTEARMVLVERVARALGKAFRRKDLEAASNLLDELQAHVAAARAATEPRRARRA